jgi:hypothetical protein
MVSLPPEVSFAVLLGALSALNEVLQVIPFWWRLFFVIASIVGGSGFVPAVRIH